MIKEIEARVLLSSSKHADPWFGIKYTMNLYRGCQHQCIYCDSRSECYGIENFADVLVKVNAIELLKKELPRKRIKATIGTGAMSDPYQPLEAQRNLTGQALQVIAEQGFPVHILTKSDLVVRDIPILREIGQVFAAVSFTVTAADDDLSRRVEPGAPVTSRRFRAMEELAKHGILTGVTMMPILPYIEDNDENIIGILQRAHSAGARYVLPWFGMSLRDRQRAYYYERLNRLFPGVREKYVKRYGNRYDCGDPQAARLGRVFAEQCEQYGLMTKIPACVPQESSQPRLF